MMEPTFDQLLLRDRRRLRRAWARCRRLPEDQQAVAEIKWLDQWQQSKHEADRRAERMPPVAFTQDLPILAWRDEISEALRQHPVIVVCGETGSGKSTQLPKICLAAGFGHYGRIGHTQPRRIAARSVAERLAEELQCRLGDAVGYQVRFHDQTGPQTYVKLMTDGILLAETQTDRWLEQYEVLILDEAHERSLNIDFLLGYLHRLIPQRPELRIILTSATIDSERFRDHFSHVAGHVPLLEVSGRGYPVEVQYQPLEVPTADDSLPEDEGDAIARAALCLARHGPGDMLVFLPTERDIRDVARRLRREPWIAGRFPTYEILPLYARLSVSEQHRVFQPSSGRRIILATNVAESSLTVPGIHYVIDTGTARISRYAPRSKVQRLPVEAISRASADQRAGRCGRVAPGICVRLYSEADYLARPAFTTPEIQRTHLAAVILQASALNLGPLSDFPFLDPPRPDAIRDGYQTLYELGAVDPHRQLTPLGQRLSRMPADPRIARIILAGAEQDCLSEILIIAAALETQDPRERPAERQQLADERHARFVHQRSDFMSWLAIWDFYHELRGSLSRSQLRKACADHFLSLHKLREWSEVHRQLLQLVRNWKLPCQPRRDEYDAIHRSLLSGLLSGVAYRSGDHEYTGAGGIKFQLWPGSGLSSARPKWCLIAELIETRRRFGRTAAAIRPEWIEPLAQHLVQRTCQEPHWHRPGGRALAWESVSLFGLPIVGRRRVSLSSVDPARAREIFLREGLAGRDVDCSEAFFRHNEAFIAQVEALATKARRGDWLVDSDTLFRFYDRRLPDNVYDVASLRRWLRARKQHTAQLCLRQEDLRPQDPLPDPEPYPDELRLDGLQLPAHYVFAPGNADDGVTVTLPAEGVLQIKPEAAEWPVPGWLEDKILALIRSLPKSLRRACIPAPERARQIAQSLRHGEGDLLSIVAERLTELSGESIPAAAFRLEKLPAHLRTNFRVVDAQNQALVEGRDLRALQQLLHRPSHPGQLPAGPAGEAHEQEAAWHRDGLTDWDFGPLPAAVSLQRGGIQVRAFPALLDRQAHVALRLLHHEPTARQLTRNGLRRLYVLQQQSALRRQVDWLPDLDRWSVLAAATVPAGQLAAELQVLLADRAFLGDDPELPRDPEAFQVRLRDAQERLGGAAHELARLLPKIVAALQEARLALETAPPPNWRYVWDDIQLQWAALLPPDFLTSTPWRWLEQLPRYLRGITHRLQKLPHGNLARDRAATDEIGSFWQAYRDRAAAPQAAACEPLQWFRWMIEEYRVSCFAQPLGTSLPVSSTRLTRHLAKLPPP